MMTINNPFNFLLWARNVAFFSVLVFVGYAISDFIYESCALADIYRLEIKEASCSLCSLELIKKFSTIKGMQDVTIETQSQTVILKLYGDLTLSEDTIKEKVKESGLTLQTIKHIKTPAK